jgi:hypothetical protein
MPQAVHPGEELNFPERAKLGGLIGELVQDLENQHAKYLRRLKIWRDWWRAVPTSEVRNEPWRGASNIILPVIRIHADGVSSRYINTIFSGKDVWIGKSRNEDFKRAFLPHVPDFLNWAANDNDYNLFTPVAQWLTEGVPLGSSVMALSWERRQRWMFLPGEGGKPRSQLVNLGEGPMVRQFSRENILWQADRTIEDSEIVATQTFLSPTELAMNAQLYGWDEEATSIARGVTNPTSLSAQNRGEHLLNQGISQDPEAYAPHDVRTVWLTMPLLRSMGFDLPDRADKDARHIPIVATIHMDTRQLLSVKAKPYLTTSWPFYEMTYRTNESDGLAKMLEHIQRAATTLVNQSIDANTLANSILAVTSDPNFAAERFTPGKIPLVQNVADVREVKLSKIVTPDIALINLLLAMAERVSGINDPSLGREIRMGGHPSPATSTMALLQEARRILLTGMKQIRVELSRLGMDKALLYQQFEVQEDKINRALGERDGAAVQEFIFPSGQTASLPGNLELDLKAIDEITSPDAERQKALMVMQVNAAYFSQVMTALNVARQAGQQGAPEIAQVAIQSIQALTESQRQFLHVSDVDEVEQYLADLSGQQPGATIEAFQQAAGDRLQELASGPAGPVVPAGLPGAPTGANGGAGPQGF